MTQFTLYTKPFCQYCTRAREILKAHNVAFTEINAYADPVLKQEMIDRSGRTTFPQVFQGDKHIGGSDDLAAFARAGGFGAK